MGSANSTLLAVDVALGAAGLYIISKFLTPKATPAPLPPGPKPKPLVGNLSDLPPPGEQEWIHWAKHKDLYGMLPPSHAFNTAELTDVRSQVL